MFGSTMYGTRPWNGGSFEVVGCPLSVVRG
jgi:hypothetical protein